MASSARDMMDLVHVTVSSGDCVRRTASVLTRAQVGRVPVPPVMFGVRLLVMVVVLRRFAEELCKGLNVNQSCVFLLPFAAGKAHRYGERLRWDLMDKVSRCATRKEAEAMERAVAEALERRGHRVFWG